LISPAKLPIVQNRISSSVYQSSYSCAVTPEQVFALTRKLIDIESITGNEACVGHFLCEELGKLGFAVEKTAAAGTRFNIYAHTGKPAVVVLSTHIDTVPPWIASREDDDKIYGRGACDTKGIIAAMLAAAVRLKRDALPIGLLFLVGEERDSLGARVANEHTPEPRPRFLINGEPTENKVAIASKGALRVEITARGKMAHSAYPHLGESAIERLLDALDRVRKLELPNNPEVGPCTMNIGIIEGGRAPNVISDFAKAQLLFRMVGPSEELIKRIVAAAGSEVETAAVLDIPFVKLRTFPGMDTYVAAYTTDIPALSNWGEPILFGPGSIHVAHTDGEFIDKQEQIAAIDIYERMVRELLAK
jgi:acetylornithine deacetylase